MLGRDMILDAHLDLAFGAMLGRDLTLPLADLRAADPEGDLAAVSFDSLRRGEVGVCLGTLFAHPRDENAPWGYEDWSGAREQMTRQLDQYLRWQDGGFVRLITTKAELLDHADRWSPETSPLGVILLIEGAEGLRDADDLPAWHARGVRVLGPAWAKRNRFTGGNAETGPLTDRGRELLVAMRELNVTLDASHLPEEAFWNAVDVQPQVVATHSNSRDLVPTERHLSDEMLRAIFERGGMVGVVLYNKFLQAGWERGDARPGLRIVADMAGRLAQVVGWDRVGLGSDLDGGFGVRELPRGLESAADLPKLGELFPDGHREGVLSGNWLRYWSEHL